MTSRTHAPTLPRRPWPGTLLATLFASILLGAAVAPAAETTDAEIFHARLQAMGEFFDANPEYKTTKGSGWKPYNRIKWMAERRMGPNGELPEPGARLFASRVRAERLAASTQRAGNSWFNLGPTNFAGRINALVFDPNNANVCYIGAASGGVWKTQNGGSSWTPLTDDMPIMSVGGLAVSLVDSDLVVVGTGEATLNIDRVGGIGIWRSTNGGITWEPTSLTYGQGSGHGFHFVEAGPNGTFLAGATDGLYRSSNNGASWDTVKVGGDYYDAKWKPGDANRVYAVKGKDSAGNNVKVSTDDGLTWAKAGTGQPLSFNIGKTKLGVSVDDPSTVYALFGEFANNGLTTGFYRSTDDGATWVAMNTSSTLVGGQSWYNLVCQADPNDVDRVIIGGVKLLRSTNGGSTWSSVGSAVHDDHHAIAYVPGSTSDVWVGGDGGVWRSTNDGTSWIDTNNGIITYQFYDICVNNHGPTGYYVLGGTQDNGTDKWSGTTTWADGLGGDGMVCNISATDGVTVFGERQYGNHYRNTTSGIGSWIQVNSGITGSGTWVTPVDQDPNDGRHLYTTSADGIFRTANSGASWTHVAGHGATWISISPVDGDVVWTVLFAASPKYTTDDGATWVTTSAYGFLVSNAAKILAHPTEVGTALVGFASYSSTSAHVAYTTDMGATWNDATGDLPPQPVIAIAIDPSNPDDWYIGTETGVWFSNDQGGRWTPYAEGLPNVVVDDLEIHDVDRKLVAGTHGRGAWEILIPPAATSADEVVAPAASRTMMFDAPHPNPITDRTMLRFAAKHAGPVTLDVYDVTGRHVVNLVELPTGDGVIRTTPWLPDTAPSGVYFAVLRAGRESMTRKMVVTR